MQKNLWNGFQVFDVDNGKMVFDQELYNEMVYKASDNLFHTFEADNCVAGLSFLSADEADNFRKTVEGRQTKRRTK